MKDYQQRVIDEKNDLDVKIGKLTAFLDSEKAQELPPGETPRMTRQLEAMKAYSEVLGQRIHYFV